MPNAFAVGPFIRRLGFASCIAASLGACSAGGDTNATEGAGDTEGGDTPVASDFDVDGPSAIGTTAIVVAARSDDPEGRTLWVQIWYPAEPSADAEVASLAELEPDADRRDAIAALVDAARTDAPGCVRSPTGAQLDAPWMADADGGSPVVVMSHCHDCVRWGGARIAERLASHGLVVVAPDHTDNTLFDRLDGEPGPLSPAMLELRAGDIARVLDLLADPSGTALESVVPAGRLDLERVGMIGHSFGAMTLGRVLQDDSRVDAGMAIAAPLVVFPGTEISAIDDPVFTLRALEDNSIGALGNMQMESQFETLAGEAWLADVADAGHWSFFDIAGLTADLAAGCGEGERQTDPGVPFTYLDNERARAIAASYAGRFFAHTLLEIPLDEGLTESVDPAVDVRARP